MRASAAGRVLTAGNVSKCKIDSSGAASSRVRHRLGFPGERAYCKYPLMRGDDSPGDMCPMCGVRSIRTPESKDEPSGHGWMFFGKPLSLGLNIQAAYECQEIFRATPGTHLAQHVGEGNSSFELRRQMPSTNSDSASASCRAGECQIRVAEHRPRRKVCKSRTALACRFECQAVVSTRS